MKNIWIFILLCAALVAVSVRLMIVSNQGSEESDDGRTQGRLPRQPTSRRGILWW